jgi:oligoribonuclease NrnB/cAMP/cGMP phosphodiesterase (DHH superfamily)
MKILNITHTDLDGFGCNLALVKHYGKDNVHLEKCGYNNVNGTLYKYLKEGDHRRYDRIYITDISISEKMATWVEGEFKDKVVLIDHHPTAEFLTKYDWATVETHDLNGVAISATKLVSNYLGIECPVILDVVSLANDYDCWHWANNGNIKAKELNDLLYMVGFDDLLADALRQSAVFNRDGIIEEFQFRKEYRILLDNRKKEYQYYLDSTKKYVEEMEMDGYKFGFVFAEQYLSELGNDLAKLHPELDFIAMLNMRSGLSLRGIKDGIDLGLIAKRIGERLDCPSGGHRKAAGVTLNKDFKLDFARSIFKQY